jgi:hypothetical protein
VLTFKGHADKDAGTDSLATGQQRRGILQVSNGAKVSAHFSREESKDVSGR